ncbi:MAG: hypothetical protein COC12_12645 [Rhodobacteraceae bacterium]|nr:MAG: hypothetical protein COC12_12645 [Paracoccaceae bacterium]
MSEILQTSLPYDPMAPRALPGISALKTEDWLTHDEAYDAQMGERDRLLRDHRPDVLAMDQDARPAAQELLDLVLGLAFPGAGAQVTRPDGVQVVIDRDDPLGTLGRLIQEDLCILQKTDDVHVMTGAVLCFPASWTLAEKFMAPLIGIHASVQGYDAGIAARVQRLFDGVQAGRPLWRFNALWYEDATLYQPRSINDPETVHDAENAGYLRSERQSILRLPQTGAVVFSIHTYVLARAAVMGEFS